MKKREGDERRRERCKEERRRGRSNEKIGEIKREKREMKRYYV